METPTKRTRSRRGRKRNWEQFNSTDRPKDKPTFVQAKLDKDVEIKPCANHDWIYERDSIKGNRRKWRKSPLTYQAIFRNQGEPHS